MDADTGIITTVAGTSIFGFSGDGGQATAAQLLYPQSVAVDGAGNLFIADTNNQRVRKVDGNSGIIMTVAGDGELGFDGDGSLATSAKLAKPSGVAMDGAGNLFIADTTNSRIRRVDEGTGIITTVAGNGITGDGGDGGPATDGQLNTPLGIAVDGIGNLFIADTNNHRVRKVDGVTGIITTVAGNGTPGYNNDGIVAVNAQLDSPAGVAVDSAGNLFIADTDNHRIRKVDGVTGIISTVAGNGLAGFGGDGGAATTAQLARPYGVAVDSAGNLIIADFNNHRIRKVQTATGIITTVAGNGSQGFSGDGGPAAGAQLDSPRSVAVDSAGSLFIGDTGNHRVRRVDGITGAIATVAGNGSAGFSGDGGPAAGAQLDSPRNVAVDSAGNLFIADIGNHRVRRVDGITGIITTVAGNGTAGFSGEGGPAASTQLDSPTGVAMDGGGSLYIAEANGHRIRKVQAGAFLLDDANPDDGDGVSQSVTFSNLPAGAYAITEVVSPGWQLVAANCSGGTDGGSLSGETLAVNIAAGEAVICTFDNQPRTSLTIVNASTPASNADFTFTSNIPAVSGASLITTIAGGESLWGGGDGAPATAAELDIPNGVVVDEAGNVFISFIVIGFSGVVRKVDAVTGIITTVAGNGTAVPGDGGPATSAKLGTPSGMAVDSAGNLFIADATDHRIRKVDAATGIITTVAGNGSAGFGGDGGPATSARLYTPVGVAVDSAGNLFIADTSTDRIRKVDGVTGIITTVAGGGIGGSDGEAAASSQLTEPTDVAVDAAGNLFIADADDHRIRRVDAVTGIITTVAGNGTAGFSGDGGPATAAQLDSPTSVTVDSAGNLFLADYNNNRIRKVDAITGIITTVAGNGTDSVGGDAGPAASSQLAKLVDVAVDSTGSLFIATTKRFFSDANRIRKVQAGTFVLDDASPDDGDGVSQSVTVSNLPAGAYAIGEVVSPGWQLAAANCSGGVDGGSLSGETLAVNTASGEAVTCTFDNQPRTSLTIIKDATPDDKADFTFTSDIPAVSDASTISTVAGIGNSAGDGGPATAAPLEFPQCRGGGRRRQPLHCGYQQPPRAQGGWGYRHYHHGGRQWHCRLRRRRWAGHCRRVA